MMVSAASNRADIVFNQLIVKICYCLIGFGIR